MDQSRAKEILQSSETIQVLFDGAPVWIESLKDNNSAVVSFIENHSKVEAPIYKLVEVSPKPKH